MSRSSFLLLSLLAAGSFVACAAEGDDAESQDDEAGETVQDVVGAGRRVCSWNIRRLGNQFDDLPKDFASTVKIIRDNCDLVALQEVMATSGGGAAGYDQLLAAIGPRYWGGVVTEHAVPNPPTSNSESYAFIWRKSAVSVCNGWSGARFMKDDEDVFIREPAWACFKLKASPTELVLGSYHALFGSMPERKREISFLDDDIDRNGVKDDLFEAMKDSRPGTTPDIMLIGDFNLKPKDLAEVLPRYVDLTDGAGSTINASNDITDNQYDHAVVPAGSRLLEGTKPAETLDVRRVAPAGKYYSTVSDHLPIRLILQ